MQWHHTHGTNIQDDISAKFSAIEAKDKEILKENLEIVDKKVEENIKRMRRDLLGELED